MTNSSPVARSKRLPWLEPYSLTGGGSFFRSRQKTNGLRANLMAADARNCELDGGADFQMELAQLSLMPGAASSAGAIIGQPRAPGS